jgi:hypothetical protein
MASSVQDQRPGNNVSDTDWTLARRNCGPQNQQGACGYCLGRDSQPTVGLRSVGADGRPSSSSVTLLHRSSSAILGNTCTGRGCLRYSRRARIRSGRPSKSGLIFRSLGSRTNLDEQRRQLSAFIVARSRRGCRCNRERIARFRAAHPRRGVSSALRGGAIAGSTRRVPSARNVAIELGTGADRARVWGVASQRHKICKIQDM